MNNAQLSHFPTRKDVLRLTEKVRHLQDSNGILTRRCNEILRGLDDKKVIEARRRNFELSQIYQAMHSRLVTIEMLIRLAREVPTITLEDHYTLVWNLIRSIDVSNAWWWHVSNTKSLGQLLVLFQDSARVDKIIRDHPEKTFDFPETSETFADSPEEASEDL